MFTRIKFLVFFFFLASSSSFAFTLSESVETALKQNAEILVQSEKIRRLEAMVRQAFSEYLPRLDVEGALGLDYRTPITYDIAGTPFTLFPDEAATVSNLKLLLAQNIYTGGKISSRLDIAKLQLEIARVEMERMKQRVAFEASAAYYNVLRADKLYDLSIESDKVAKAHLRQVENYVEVGRAPRSDLLLAEVKAAENELLVLQARNKLQVAEIALKDVLGKGIGEAVEVAEALPGTEEEAPLDFDKLLALAYANRPDWRAQTLRKSISGREIELARAEFLPDIGLLGSVSKNIENFPSNGLRREVDYWNIYGRVSWNIFNGFKTQNKVEGAMASLAETENEEGRTRNRIAAQVKEAHLNYQAARLCILRGNREVNYAKENLEQALAEYKRGVVGNVEYLKAREILARAESDLVVARVDLELAKAQINQAVGQEVIRLY